MVPLFKRVLLVMVVSLAGMHTTHALTINRNFIGGASGDTVLQTIFNTAADMWEAAIADNHVFSVNVDFTTLNSGVLGKATVNYDGTGRTTSAEIRFNSAIPNWFMDTTPLDNSEFAPLQVTSRDLGGGLMEIRRRYARITVTSYDMLSVALHEIGHSLGMHSGNVSGDINVTGGPFDGALIIMSGAHININRTLMFPSTDGSRHLISQMDLAAICTVANYTQCDYSAVTAVPEPSTWLLFAFGATGLAMLRRRTRRA